MILLTGSIYGLTKPKHRMENDKSWDIWFIKEKSIELEGSISICLWLYNNSLQKNQEDCTVFPQCIRYLKLRIKIKKDLLKRDCQTLCRTGSFSVSGKEVSDRQHCHSVPWLIELKTQSSSSPRSLSELVLIQTKPPFGRSSAWVIAAVATSPWATLLDR